VRKYISIALTIIVLFNLGGYYLMFCIAQYNIRKEIKKEIINGLNNKDLTLIIVPFNDESNLCWIESNKEFRYKGEMYDVVKIQNQCQKKYYYCINDRKEKQLIANYDKNHNTKKDSGKKIKNLFNFFLYQQKSVVIKYTDTSDLPFAAIKVLYKLRTITIHSPPPKSA
jgi:hypothetical protein